MGPRDLRLVGVHKRPSANHVDTSDDEVVDPVGAGEDEPGDRIVGTAELEPVRPPDGDVRALADFEGADVGAPKEGRSTSGRETQGFAHGHRIAAAATAGDEQRLLDLEEEVSALIRCGAVDTETDADVAIEEVAHGSDTGSEPQVRG